MVAFQYHTCSRTCAMASLKGFRHSKGLGTSGIDQVRKSGSMSRGKPLLFVNWMPTEVVKA